MPLNTRGQVAVHVMYDVPGCDNRRVIGVSISGIRQHSQVDC